jgi:TolB-like protein
MRRAVLILLLVLAPRLAAARTIAISYFDNNTGDAALDPLRKGLADMLITDLGNVGAVQIVERDKLNQVIGELKLQRSKFIDPKTAQKLGKGLAAELIMTGGYVIADATMRVDVRVVEVATGKIVASDKVEGKKEDFFSIEKDLVDLLIKTLDVKLSSGERGKLRSNATESFDAWQKYSAGLDAKDRGDDAEARKQFQAALDADPNYRAAKTATERLRVIFQRGDDARTAEVDKTLKSLDPKAPDFAQKVDQALSQLGRDTPEELRKKINLLRYLAEHDLTPSIMAGYSRVPTEVMALVWTYDKHPDAEALLTPVCEYLISRYPKDQTTPAQCKTLLKVLDVMNKQPADQRKRMWDDEWSDPRLDWQISLKACLPDMLSLFKLYAKKVKRP